jgi:2-dehydro-3-deoxyphosphogluconate aldolase/(4S)-4-hydroxy-2-oxoglutarate aldolase
MSDSEFVKFVAENRIFATLQAESAEVALRAAEAAILGGIKLVEVPLATPGQYRVISELRRVYGDRACIGAGSVMTEEQIDRAVKSGAQFIGMPHTNKILVEICRRQRAFPIVGALTPTEIAYAWAVGVPLLSVFPAFALGGADYLAALVARLVGVRLIAAGDVGPDSISDYFAAGAFAVSVGKRLFTQGDLRNRDYQSISERARGIRRLAGVS